MNTTITLLCLSCCALLVQGRLKSKRGFPPIGTGAVPGGMGPFGVISGLDPFQAPQYLRDVTEDARQEYFAILRNSNRTIAEHKDEVMRWARKYLLEVGFLLAMMFYTNFFSCLLRKNWRNSIKMRKNPRRN